VDGLVEETKMKNAHRKLAMVVTLALVTTLTMAVAPAVAKKGGKPAPDPACIATTELSGAGNLGLSCDWTPSNTGEPGRVVVEVIKGRVAYLAIAVRDSSPGDYCAGPILWGSRYGPGATFEATFDLVGAGSTYWDAPVDWCGTARSDQNGQPLAVTVHARVKKGTQLQITLDPPPET